MKKDTSRKIRVEEQEYTYYPIDSFGASHISHLPFVKRILLENLIRNQHKSGIDESTMSRFAQNKEKGEIPFYPHRVLMQDFTGVPAIVDLASVREVVEKKYKRGKYIDPQIPVDVIIDHSVEIECSNQPDSLECNKEKEYQQNHERYSFLKWASTSFSNLSIVPPSSGICHQVNLEYLAKVVNNKEGILFPDTLIGTDSHTTMINGLGVLGWGVGGIEAEATMLGLEYTLSDIKVVGVNLVGEVDPFSTSTDIVLSITEFLRKEKVVGSFVEFFGKGYQTLSVVDRATIANMSPEYGSTCGYFPVDEQTLSYLKLTNREHEATLVEKYCKENHLFYKEPHAVHYDKVLTFDLSSVTLSVAGPTRPQDRIPLKELAPQVIPFFKTETNIDSPIPSGAIAIAAITSCTNTSNPKVMIGAALLAKKAVELGLSIPSWVKTSFAPGSKVVTEYLSNSGLLPYLEKLGFYVDAYGCTTCIGNSGPLHRKTQQAYESGVPLAAILSGNRNFTGRIHQSIKGAFLASPLLVVSYAIAGSITKDIYRDPIGKDKEAKDVYLMDIWPSKEEIEEIEEKYITKDLYKKVYDAIYNGDKKWEALPVTKSLLYDWDEKSTYIRKAPFFDSIGENSITIKSILSSRILALFKDSITTDHISPAGAINPDYPAGSYLSSKGIEKKDFNSYGSRRGNVEVMVRGTFANIRIRNGLNEYNEGGYTTKFPENQKGYFYNIASLYKKEGTPVVIIAGSEYGTGSSRDWAAKGTYLLGVKCVIAQSFERIHRSNLIGMGVLPLEFMNGQSASFFHLSGDELIDICIDDTLTPKQIIDVSVTRGDNRRETFSLLCRIENEAELLYYKQRGILIYATNQLLSTL
ncbi:MAG: aconitate hydratase AcnA [Spirochaetia bacterium]|nr:aconitate hydratase AcnA [Spirochaetia bacterium]